jgi:hypothetical protein
METAGLIERAQLRGRAARSCEHPESDARPDSASAAVTAASTDGRRRPHDGVLVAMPSKA